VVRCVEVKQRVPAAGIERLETLALQCVNLFKLRLT
jgi:hypothetical protein